MNSTITQLLLDCAIKVSLMTGVVFVGMRSAQHLSASVRHWLWLIVMAGSLMLPIAAVLMPSWSVPLLPVEQTQMMNQRDTADALPSAAPPLSRPNSLPQDASSVTSLHLDTTPVVFPEIISQRPFPWTIIPVVLWLIGALAVALYWLCQLWTISHITRLATHCTSRLHCESLQDVQIQLNVKRTVALVISDRVTVPMTWGWRKPTILLPTHALHWSGERLHIVLLHEMAHIARRDYLTQWIALLACAVHWYHPLIWYATWQLGLEREKACDDLVLGAGVGSINYAEHLVEIAKQAANHRLVGSAIAIAHRSDIQHRIQYMLDRSRNRTRLSLYGGLTLIFGAFALLLPFSSVRLTHAQAPTSTKAPDLIHAAEAAVQAGDLNGAAANYTKLCETYYRTGETELARQSCEKALTLDSKYIDAYKWLGQVLYTRRNYADAIQALQTCATLDMPNTPQTRHTECWWLRGLAYFATNDCEKAVPIFNDLLAWTQDQHAIEMANFGRGKCSDQPTATTASSDPIPDLAGHTLANAIKRYNAASGELIIMQPRTGQMLAMAWQTPDGNKLNPIIGTIYEPGSAFSIVTGALALDSGKISPDWTYFDHSPYTIGGRNIYNWDRASHGVQSFDDVFVKSWNIGTAHLTVDVLGATLFYKGLRDFGIEEPTSLRIENEARTLVPFPGDIYWSDSDLATNSYGQGLGITPLHMLLFTNAIANDGKIMQPFVKPPAPIAYRPTLLRQPISAETAHTMTDIMVHSIESPKGEGKLAYVPGYHIAGKVGTAQIPCATCMGGYDPELMIVSFVGFFPADDPQVSVLIKLDRVNKFGAETAAPAFAELVPELAQLLDIKPE